MTYEYFVLLMLAAALQPIAASAAERMPVTTVKPLLIAAIERGEAHGVLTGDAAAFVRRRFNANAPIEIDVKALRPLPQAGCKRLQVTTQQRTVTEATNTPAQTKALIYEVSYCRDGRFPESK